MYTVPCAVPEEGESEEGRRKVADSCQSEETELHQTDSLNGHQPASVVAHNEYYYGQASNSSRADLHNESHQVALLVVDVESQVVVGSESSGNWVG